MEIASLDELGATLVAVTHDHELLKRFDRVIDFQEFQTEQEAGHTSQPE